MVEVEEWRTVPNTDDSIMVSNLGRVCSLLRGKEPYILKCQKDKKGYLRLRVTINRKKVSFKLHRLVANAFIDNPDNLPQVNHIDGHKDNNCVTNLEWCTNRDNVLHAIRTGLIKTYQSNTKGSTKKASTGIKVGINKGNELRKKPIIAINILTGEEIYFDCMCDAERKLNTKHINAVIKGERKQSKGFRFMYAGEVS